MIVLTLALFCDATSNRDARGWSDRFYIHKKRELKLQKLMKELGVMNPRHLPRQHLQQWVPTTGWKRVSLGKRWELEQPQPKNPISWWSSPLVEFLRNDKKSQSFSNFIRIFPLPPCSRKKREKMDTSFWWSKQMIPSIFLMCNWWNWTLYWVYDEDGVS